MAQTLSQYIAEIRTSRDRELTSKLQGLLPLMEQDIKQKQVEEEKAKEREGAMNYYTNVMKEYGYSDQDIEAFRTTTTDVPTEHLPNILATNMQKTQQQKVLSGLGVNVPEGADAGEVGRMATGAQAAINLGPEWAKEYNRLTNEGISPEMALAEVTAKAEAESGRQKIESELSVYEQKLGIASKYDRGSGVGGGGSGDSPKAWEQYSAVVNPKDRIAYFRREDGSLGYDFTYVDNEGNLRWSRGAQRIDPSKLLPLTHIDKTEKEDATQRTVSNKSSATTSTGTSTRTTTGTSTGTTTHTQYARIPGMGLVKVSGVVVPSKYRVAESLLSEKEKKKALTLTPAQARELKKKYGDKGGDATANNTAASDPNVGKIITLNGKQKRYVSPGVYEDIE